MLLNATPLNGLVLNGTGGYYVPLAASVSASAQTVGTAAKQSNLGVAALCTATLAGAPSVSKPLGGTLSAGSGVTASADLQKIIAASADAVLTVVATALLGKRLDGDLLVEANAHVALAIAVRMGGSLSVEATDSVALAKTANVAGDLLALASVLDAIFVERSAAADVVVSATARGELVFTHLVDAYIGGGSTFEQSYTEIFPFAEVVYPPGSIIRATLEPGVYETNAEAEVQYPELSPA